MKIAVVGSGISGLAAGWLLDRKHEVHLFEKRTRLGFDERFIRLWDFYLATCEAAFLQHTIGDLQIQLSRVGEARS